MSEGRKARLEQLYDEHACCSAHSARPSSVVDTTAIKTLENDIRTVLEYFSAQYCDETVKSAMRRLRKVIDL